MSAIFIREYLPDDKEPALQCFRSNVPSFFSPSDEAWFESALDEPDGPNFVVVSEGAVIGFGGYEVSHTYNSAVLVFGHIDARWHGKGLGRMLLEYRINHLRTYAQPTKYLVVDTLLKVAPFYVRQGFEIVAHWKEGFRDGTDRIDLRLVLL